MVPVLSLLALLPVVDPFSMLGAEVLRSRHQDRVILVAGLGGLAVLVLLGNPLTIALGGVGMVIANYLCHTFSLVTVFRLRRIMFSGYYQLLRRLPAVYFIALIPLAASSLIPLTTPWTRLAAAGISVAIAWALLALLFFRQPRPILNLERD